MRYSFTRPNEVRAKLAELTTEPLVSIAEMIIDLEHELELMTDDRDDRAKELEAAAQVQP